MRLASLYLCNFRQHALTEIQFESGITGIFGPNGAGKSSLVEAIAFALYGVQAIRGNLADLKRRGCSARDPFEVRLVFEHDNIVYRVERGISDGKLFIAGADKPITSNNRETTAAIERLLRLNYDEFIASYYTEQKGLQFLSGQKGATEREKFIMRMIGYDRLEKIQELLREDRKSKRSELQGIEAGLGTRQELESCLRVEMEHLALAEESYKNSSKVLKNADLEVLRLKGEYDKLESQKLKFDKLLADIERITILTQQQGKRRESILQDLDEMPSLDALEELISQSRLALLKLRTEIQQLETETQAEQSLWRERTVKIEAELATLSEKNHELTERERNYTALKENAPCPTCGKELGAEFHDVKGHLRVERESLAEHISMLYSELKVLSTEPEMLIEKKVKLSSAKKSLAVQECENASLIERRAKLEGVRLLQAELSRIDDEQIELNKKRAALDDELSELSFKADLYTRTKAGYEAAMRLLEVSRLQNTRAEGEHEMYRSLVERARATLEQYDQRRASLQSLKTELVLLEEGDALLTNFRRDLNSTLRPRLAELSGEFLAELTDGRYNTVEVQPDFTPTVVEDGDPKAIISGGEEDILNLCVRLGLSTLVSERAGHTVSLLVLDEVFGSLDEFRRANVLVLLEQLRKRFEQILIITHMDDIRESIQNAIYVDYNHSLDQAVVRKVEADFLIEGRVVNL